MANRIQNCNAVGHDGFTLVEVMVALTLLAGSMFALLNAHYAALSLHMFTAEEVDSRILLESAVALAEIGVAADELSGSGDFGARYAGYVWTYEAQEISEEGNPLMDDTVFYRVTVTLQHPDGESKSLEFLSFSNAEMRTVQQVS